jgi:hypothetical protein
MFQLLLSPATTTPLANGPPWHHRPNVGSANHRPAQFRADLAWRSRRVVSPHELWRRVLSMHRPSVVCRLSPTGTSAWLPFDNTTDADPPRFFNWKSLHLTNYPASDVLCRRTDTVGGTSGSRHRLTKVSNFARHFRERTHSETRLTRTIRTPLVPNGLRTTLLTVQNA